MFDRGSLGEGWMAGSPAQVGSADPQLDPLLAALSMLIRACLDPPSLALYACLAQLAPASLYAYMPNAYKAVPPAEHTANRPAARIKLEANIRL